MTSSSRVRLSAAAAWAAASLVSSTAFASSELELKRVVLSSGGLGLYEYRAQVDGDATVELKAPLDQIDDILKSLVVFDDRGGVGGLDLPSREPLAETFRNLPFSADDLKSAPNLLEALRGAEITVGGAHAISGRIVSVAEEARVSPEGRPLEPRHRVTVMTDQGLEQFVLEDAENIEFADPKVRAELDTALKALAANGEKDARVLRLTSEGKGPRTLSVSYVVAAPLWKASYRLVLPSAPDAEQAELQGWATLENLSGQNWKDVDLTLVSGRPVTFRQALYRAYMVERPEAPVEVVGRLLPPPDRGEIPEPKAAATHRVFFDAPQLRAMAGTAAAAPMATPPPSEASLAPGAETVAAEEGLTQVSFHIPFPVSVGNGRTLSLPIIDAEEPVERIALYDSTVDPRRPLSAVRISNAGKSGLPPGIVTTYQQGDEGVVYVGDSQLSDLPAGDYRLLSYALDQKTLIEASHAETSGLERATITKGMLTVETLSRSETSYRVKALAPRRLVISMPELDGWKLVAPVGITPTVSEGRYRIPFDVKAGDGQTFVVAQVRTNAQVVALANIDDRSLGFYLAARDIDPATRERLVRLADLRSHEAAAEAAVRDVEKRIADVVADQARLKDLLPAVVSGSDLQKRYLAELDQDETELGSLRAARATKQQTRNDARKAVEDWAASL